MQRTPPDIAKLLGSLADYDVEYVLAGSVAVEAWGVEVGTPGDLDIVPATDELNLQKLADMLTAVEAEPFPIVGEWEITPDGTVWRELGEDDPRRGAVPPPPDPANPTSFDSLYSTLYGALDVVPIISGTFQDMAPRSSRLILHGVGAIRVMSIEDLLAQLTVPRRTKDAYRVTHLRAVQRQR